MTAVTERATYVVGSVASMAEAREGERVAEVADGRGEETRSEHT
jgi:hypothetical protein